MTKNAPASTTEDDVLDFLKNNPDFVARHPDILDYLNFPTQNEKGTIVNFQQLMVNKLRNDKQRAEDRQRSMIDNARNNMTIQARVHAGVVRMLEAQTLDELADIVTGELTLMLEVDVVSLCLETVTDLDMANSNGVRAIPAGAVNQILDDRDSLLEANIDGNEYFFGSAARLVKSQAFLRLTIDEELPDGLLVFGSRDPLLFTDGQGTELIGFLSDVIERLLRRFLHEGR